MWPRRARWRLIADTLELTVRRFYALVLAGIGANNVLPLRLGDILRARWLATSAEIPSGQRLRLGASATAPVT